MDYDDEVTNDGGRERNVNQRNRHRSPSRGTDTSRRAFLGSIAAGGALTAGGYGGSFSSTAEATDAAGAENDGPSVPTTLETSAPPAGSGVELSWDGPSDPCSSPISYYVVTVDGEVAKTVPAGVTRTIVDSPGDTVGVYAVDDTGTASEAVTAGGDEMDSTPPHLVGFRTNSESVGTSDSVRVGITVETGTADRVEFDSFELSVEVSTPCAATITDASYTRLDDIDDEAPEFANDGSSVTLSATGLEVDSTFRRLADIEVTGHDPRATVLEITDVTLIDGGEPIDIAPDWMVLEVSETERTGPQPPRTVESTTPEWGRGVELRWDEPLNPCDASPSHYVVRRDGEDVTTVPAGVTRAQIEASDAGDGAATYGVAAVDDDGTESVAVTTEAAVDGEEPSVLASVAPGLDGTELEEIAVGETVPAELRLRPGADDVPDLESFVAEVGLSTPCAVRITSVSYSDAFSETDQPEFIRDRGGVILSADGFDGDVDDEVVLATLELSGRAAAGTELTVDGSIVTAEGNSVALADDWTTLTVTPLPADAPPAPSNLDVEQGVSQSVDVFWDGVDDPCDPDLSHYSVVVNGEEADTVPIGVNSTVVYPPGEGPVSVSVRTVSEDGVESYPIFDELPIVGIADPGTTLRVDVPDSIEPGETVEAPLVLNEVLGTIPAFFSYDLEVSVTAPCAVEITGASYPTESRLYEELLDERSPEEMDEQSLQQVLESESSAEEEPLVAGPTEPSIAEDGSSVRLAVDGFGSGDLDYDLEIATVELTGVAEGHTDIDISVSEMESPDPFAVWPRWSTLGVAGEPDLPPVGDSEEPPQDRNGDGLYRDVNGNGQLDEDDVVTFFENLEEPEITEYTEYYDFTEDGRLGFADVLELLDDV